MVFQRYWIEEHTESNTKSRTMSRTKSQTTVRVILRVTLVVSQKYSPQKAKKDHYSTPIIAPLHMLVEYATTPGIS